MPKRHENNLTQTFATIWDVIECKGRIGSRGSLKERLAKWLAQYVTAAAMRDPKIRKEFALIVGMELVKHRRQFEIMFGEAADARKVK